MQVASSGQEASDNARAPRMASSLSVSAEECFVSGNHGAGHPPGESVHPAIHKIEQRASRFDTRRQVFPVLPEFFSVVDREGIAAVP